MARTAEVTLRPATEDDDDLLLRVYASTRVDELSGLPWDDATKTGFLAQQLAAQSAHFSAHYGNAEQAVVEVAGVAAGRLCVDRGERDIRVLDIALLPEFRGAGVGGELLAPILAEADATGRTVSLHVRRENPASGLYDRLGFTVLGEAGADLLMIRQPKTA